ncbi:MAG: CARDB domain-containing protein [Solirubrobacteraceae bacterium]|jgi:hypothetical protein
MTSRIVACALSALVCSAAPAVAGPAHAAHRVASAPAALVDSATLAACVQGSTASARTASFSATMQTLPRVSAMAVSFDLYERTTRGAPFTRISAPGFGAWQVSSPGIASFTATENVVDLPASGAFRAVVHYRWIGAHHRVLDADLRVTPACVEAPVAAPEPDLVIASIVHSPGSPPQTTEDYEVLIRDIGPGAAGSFQVGLSVGGTALPDQTVDGLASAATTTVQFTGPRCTPGSTLTATVDPGGAITEPSNARRTVSLTCPSPASTGSDTAG